MNSRFGPGTKEKEIRGTRIIVCCISPDYRDCLDAAMKQWKQHKKQLPKTLNGKDYRPGIYAFAYWLIRWSGLVVPAKQHHQGEVK